MEEAKKPNRWLVPALLAVLILLVGGVLIFVLKGRGAEESALTEINDGPPILAYAEGVTIVDDESSLQAAVDKLFNDANREMVASFQAQAFSEDGTNFTCYIANSEYNEFDMYISIYEDLGEDEEPLFLSGLMRPGEAFREISLTRPLDKGTHEVNLVFTQVKDDHATIQGQSIVALQMEVD